MQQVTLERAASRLADLVDAAVAGEDIILDGTGHGSVRLVPVTVPVVRPRFGSAKGLIQMADDFDAPLDDLREYTEPGR